MTILEIPTPDPRSFDEASRPFAEAVSARYAIKRLIGRGGMGIVYLARDRRLDRLVAIKTMPPHLAADNSLRERFLRETRTAGAMSHPNIVPIHGADEIDGHVFFVMGYVEGDSLAAHVRGNGRLEPGIVARNLRDVADALVHAHERGIVHRDIKAENILIERSSGRALVTDFGIARVAEAGPLTSTGQMLGTVYYISPEQVSGDRVDARSDLYSLGVVGFFALTGRFPFEAELASAVLIAHVNKPAPPVRSINGDVPLALAQIIDRCLAKDPARRYANAGELLSAIGGVIAGLDRPEKGSASLKLVSDAEAQSVWQRAAELQASTGIRPRPAPIPLERNDESDRARTSGFRVDAIRDAAREAGISTRYIDHALVERGLSAAPAVVEPVARRIQRNSWWAGVPLEILEQVEVEGEVEARHFDRLFNILRDGTADVGTTTASKREMGWQGNWLGHRLDVSVVPSDGKTAVRLTDRIRRSAARIMAVSVGVGIVVGPMFSLIAMDMMSRPTPRWIHALGLNLWISRPHIYTVAQTIGVLALIASIPVAQLAIRRMRRLSVARLRTMTEAIVANVQLAVHDRLK